MDAEKQAAAEEAAQLIEPGMRVGLGTGTTVAFLLPALAERGLKDLRCVATSDETAKRARELGLPVEPFDSLESLERLDIAIDGADQVAPDNWLVKGGGGAHTREKIVAAAAERFVVIVDQSKKVKRLEPPVPLELASFGIAATLARLSRLGEVAIREDAPTSPDGGVIADYRGGIGDPTAFAAWIASEPGVVEHGLFPPRLVSDVIVGGAAD
jgi:ribose 5-phosphate isomerase A